MEKVSSLCVGRSNVEYIRISAVFDSDYNVAFFDPQEK